MGIVYLALEQGPGGFAKLKVIKRLRADLGEEPEAVRMFLEEGRLSARLHHPNVVQTNAVGFDGKHHYLEMEYLEGHSFDALNRRASRTNGAGVPIAIAVHVLAKTLAGLHYAHELRDLDGSALTLVHRDVSPHNVFVTYDGEVKLLDFGIARAAGSSSETKTGFLKGKVTYMAPEQVAREPLDRRVDLFAVGVMLWEALAGARLWGDLDDFQIFLKLRSEDIPSPRSVREVPEALEAICMRALARTPADRYASGAEMQRALEAWLESQSERVGSRELAETMDALFAGQRAATKAEIEQQIRATPATTGGVGVPMLQTVSPTGESAPGVESERGEQTRIREQRQLRGFRRLARVAVGVTLAASLTAGVATWRAREKRAAKEASEGLSTNADAVVAYRAGMQALRDADSEGASRAFDRAIELDADFAAAHLRRAIVNPLRINEPERAHLREAIRLRARLGAHERQLVDAYAPRASVPEDAAETERRIARAFQSDPSDADFAYALCRAQLQIGAYSAARETCRRDQELDPHSAEAMNESGMALVRLGDEDGARAMFEACLRESPLASSCLQRLTQLESNEGRCTEALANIRRTISMGHARGKDYGLLASLLVATGEPLEGARLALDLQVAHTEPAKSAIAKSQTAAAMAIFLGDFTAAEKALDAWSDVVASSQDESEHLPVTVPHIQLAEEEGKTDEAIALANDYLSHRATWTVATSDDLSMFFHGVLYRLGALSRADFVERRTRWLTAKSAQPAGSAFGSSAGFAWIEAFARPSLTPDDAREALDALPRYLPLPDPFMRLAEFELPIGHAYRLAGRAKEALPFLTVAAGSCEAIDYAIEIALSDVELGLAEEQLGDREAACAAYARVEKRWGASHPLAVSASQARKRMRALGCP
jgi:serine/threonine-protein kinase